MAEPDEYVLVVDDDEDIRDILGELLQEQGYAVLRAADGAAALDVLRAGRRVCVIVLDLMMPGLSGWDFRAAQLRDPALAPIPVVVITASGAPATGLGDVRMIRKPLRFPDVVDAVKEHCRAA